MTAPIGAVFAMFAQEVKMKSKIHGIMNSGRRRWYLLIPLIILAFLIWYQLLSSSAIEALLLQEKAHERRQSTELIHAMMETFVEKGISADARESILVAAVAYMEANFDSTFAQVYDEQLNPLNVLHLGVGGGEKHDPLDYPEFIEAVLAALNSDSDEKAGDLVYWYETPQAGGRDIYMTFRWMPTDYENSERLLVAIGISRFSLTAHIPMVYDAVIWIMIFVVAFTTLLMVFVIIRQTVRADKYEAALSLPSRISDCEIAKNGRA
jgi:hypothetical protein